MERHLESKSIKHTASGVGSNVKGKVKDAAGGLTGNPGLQAKGKMDQAKAKFSEGLALVEEKTAQIGRAIEGEVTELGERLKNAAGALAGKSEKPTKKKTSAVRSKSTRRH